ncbi:MAG: hypothetical protein DHS20C11_16230 [Lysobacteraceae bacterium]|nr:MAG: hypothetical protein DHS20C11_16230 [Xanthomonadaceae bacterium]
MISLTLLLTSTITVATAADSGPRTPQTVYELRRQTTGLLASEVSSPDYRLAATVGQAFADLAGSSGDAKLNSGFWAGSRNPSDTIFKDNFDGGVAQ